MALINELRTYFETAFTGKYFEKADNAFNILKQMVADPATKFENFKLPGSKSREDKTAVSGILMDNPSFEKQYSKLYVMFVDSKQLVERRQAKAEMIDFYSPFLWIFKNTSIYMMLIGVHTGGMPLTAQIVQSQMKSSRVMRHAFVHEFTHYLQSGQVASVFLPLLALRDQAPYHKRQSEIEAWNVESFSRFLAKVPLAVKKEIVSDINRFHLAFLQFLTDHHMSGASFYLEMTESQQDRFIRESFDLLRKKMAVTTKGT